MLINKSALTKYLHNIYVVNKLKLIINLIFLTKLSMQLNQLLPAEIILTLHETSCSAKLVKINKYCVPSNAMMDYDTYL